MKKSVRIFIVVSFFASIFAGNCFAQGPQVIAGAGPSTTIVQLFVDNFSATAEGKAYTFKVPPKSAKHAGGIKNSDKFIFGRTGRPLNEKEKSMGKEEIFLAGVPIAIAVGPGTGVTSLTLSQVETIFTTGNVNWKDFGGADHEIFKIGREPNEALFLALKSTYPFFTKASFQTIVKKDHQVVGLLKKEPGKFAIGFGAQPNFTKDSVPTVSIDGFSTGVNLGLVYDKKNSDHELVKAVKTFVASPKWQEIIQSDGLLLP